MPRHSPSGTRAYLGSHQWRQSVFPLLQCAFSRIGFPGRPPPDKATGDALVLPAVVGKDAGTTSSLSQSISKPSEHLSRWDPVAAALPSSGLLLTRRLAPSAAARLLQYPLVPTGEAHSAIARRSYLEQIRTNISGRLLAGRCAICPS